MSNFYVLFGEIVKDFIYNIYRKYLYKRLLSDINLYINSLKINNNS